MANKHIRLTWLRDMTFDAVADGRHLTVDSEHGRGLSPMEMALVSLAGCTAMDVVSILKKARQPFTDLVVHVEGERAIDHPRRYTEVTLIFEVHGKGVNLAAVERAVALSEEKYCSVSATFREHAEIRTRIELVDEVELEEGTGVV
jgi:putative redox protein